MDHEQTLKNFEGPFFIIPMPLDKHGKGPAMPHATVDYSYEIWDDNNITVKSFQDAKLANEFLLELNRLYSLTLENENND